LLTDNRSIFAAYKTMNIALALNLEPCFTPVESPESNGMAEAFVKTLKRDYVRVSPIGDAAAALTQGVLHRKRSVSKRISSQYFSGRTGHG
jgi:transposase InsO family protein